MLDSIDSSPNKSLADLSREALWFCIHTLIAVAMLTLVVSVQGSTRLTSGVA
jgi:hypothetical protein